MRKNFKPHMKLVTWCVDLCVSWWSDVEPPKWLQAMVQRNAAFRKSSDELNALADQLKRDADPWAELADADVSSESFGHRVRYESTAPRSVSLEPTVRDNSHRSLTRRSRLVVCTAATAAAVAFLLIRGSDSTNEQSGNPQESPIVVEGQPDSVLEDEMHALAKVVETSWDSSEAYLASISSAIDGPLPLGSRSMGNVVSERVRSFSRGYGQAVDFLAQRVEELKPDP